MALLADLKVVIGGDASGAINALRSVGSQILGLQGTSNKASKAIQGVFLPVNIVKSALAFELVYGAMRGIESLGGFIVENRLQYEQLTFQLQALVARQLMANDASLDAETAYKRAAGGAKEMYDEIQRLNIKSPFTEMETMDVFTKLMAVGFPLERARSMLEMMLNFGTGMRLQGADLTRVAKALGDVLNKGKFQAEEVRQFVNSSIPAMQIVADHFGITIAELGDRMAEGLVPGEEAVQAIVDWMGRQFPNAIDNAQKTIWGLAGALKDLAALRLRDLTSGFWEAVMPPLVALRNFLDSTEFRAKVLDWGKAFGNFVSSITEGSAKIKKAWDNVFGEMDTYGVDKRWAAFGLNLGLGPEGAEFLQHMAEKMGEVAEKAQRLSSSLSELVSTHMPNMERVFGFVNQHWDAFAAGIDGILTYLTVRGGIRAIVGLAGALNTLIGPVAIAAILVGLLWAAWDQDWFGLKTNVTAFLEGIGLDLDTLKEKIDTWIIETLPNFKAAWGTGWGDPEDGGIFVSLSDQVRTTEMDMDRVTNEKVPVWKTAWDDFVRGTEYFGERVIGRILGGVDWETMATKVGNFFGALGRGAKAVAEFGWEDLGNKIGNFVAKWEQDVALVETGATNLERVFNWLGVSVPPHIGKLDQKFWEMAVNIGTRSHEIYTAVTTKVSAMYTEATTTFNSLKTSVSGIWAALKTDTEGTIESIKTIVVTGVITFALEWIRNHQDIWRSAQTTWDNVWAKVEEIQDSIQRKVAEVWQALSGIIESAGTAAATAAEGVGVSIVQGLISGILSMTGAVGQAARYVVNVALAAMRAETQSESPSRKTHEIGSDVGEGFVNGIRAWVAATTGTAAALAQAAMDALKGYGGKILTTMDEFMGAANLQLDQAERRAAIIMAALKSDIGTNIGDIIEITEDGVRVISQNLENFTPPPPQKWESVAIDEELLRLQEAERQAAMLFKGLTSDIGTNMGDVIEVTEDGVRVISEALENFTPPPPQKWESVDIDEELKRLEEAERTAAMLYAGLTSEVGKNMGDVIEITEDGVRVISEALEGFTPPPPQKWEAGDAVMEAVMTIEEAERRAAIIFDALTSDIGTNMGDIIEITEDGVRVISSTLTEGLGEAVEIAGTNLSMLTQVLDWWEPPPPPEFKWRIGNEFLDAIPNITEAQKLASFAMEKWGSSLQEHMNEAVNATEEGTGAISQIMETFTPPPPQKWDVAEVVTDAATDVKTEVTDLQKSLTSDLAQAIRDGTPDVVTAVRELAHAAVDALKSVLQSASPARVTYQEGLNFDRGLANGIRDGTGFVVSAMQDLGKKMAEAYKGAFQETMAAAVPVVSTPVSSPVVTPIVTPVVPIGTNIGRPRDVTVNVYETSNPEKTAYEVARIIRNEGVY